MNEKESKPVNEGSLYTTRIISGLIDAVARYRSTTKLEYRLNLIMVAVVYAAAAAITDDLDKGRLFALANTLNREYGNLKEISDLSTTLNSILNKVR